MLKHNQNGSVNTAVVLLVLTILLLIGAIAFGGWAFGSRQDYKNNVDGKIAVAVEAAKQSESKLKDREAAEAAKQPLRTYNGPEAYGSLIVNFPKTWSAYIDDTGKDSSELVNGYFYPGTVPSITNSDSVFALRVQVVNQAYSDVAKQYKSLQEKHLATFSAYALPKVPKAVGLRVTGNTQEEQSKKAVDMIVLPLRSQTLKIWTEGSQFNSDFNTYILPNFSFSP